MKKTERIQILNVIITTHGALLCILGGLITKEIVSSILGCTLIGSWYILQAVVVVENKRTVKMNGKKVKGTVIKEPSKFEIGYKKIIAWFNE